MSEYEPVEVLSSELIKESLSQLYRVPDGSSYAFSTLAIEERDPPLVSLEDINRRSKTFHETPIGEMKNLRVIKLNINQLPDTNRVQSLEFLSEV